MPTNFISPFDLRTLLVDYFLGGGELFAFAFILLISMASAKFNMPNRIFLTLLLISSILMGAWLGQALYILVLMVAGFVIFKGVGRFVQ